MSPTSVSLPDSLEARYAEVRERIAAAAVKSGRRPEDVMLVAVTKAADPEQIRELMDLGHRDFGENKVQQLLQRQAMVEEYFARLKVHSTSSKGRSDSGSLFTAKSKVDLSPTKNAPASLATSPIRWHMIGHLQRNKVKKIVDFVRLIHSVDSLRLAEELQAIALKREHDIEVLIEINASGEESKQGCPLPAAIPLAEQIDTMVNVKVRGLMTMAAYSPNPEDARASFVRCRELFEEMKLKPFAGPKFNILSMGMSNDYEVAISEGANIVRVGSAIFGTQLGGQPSPEADDDD
jgi:PLP dependent protein